MNAHHTSDTRTHAKSLSKLTSTIKKMITELQSYVSMLNANNTMIVCEKHELMILQLSFQKYATISLSYIQSQIIFCNRIIMLKRFRTHHAIQCANTQLPC